MSLIAVMTAALRLLGPMDRTRLSERCLLTPKPTDLCHSAGPAFLSCVRCRRSSRLCSSPLLHVTNPRGPAALGRPWESPGVMPGGRGRFGRLGGLWTGNSAVATEMHRRGAARVLRLTLSGLEAPRAQAKNFSTMMPSVRRNLHSRTTCVHSTCGDAPSPCVG